MESEEKDRWGAGLETFFSCFWGRVRYKQFVFGTTLHTDRSNSQYLTWCRRESIHPITQRSNLSHVLFPKLQAVAGGEASVICFAGILFKDNSKVGSSSFRPHEFPAQFIAKQSGPGQNKTSISQQLHVRMRCNA